MQKSHPTECTRPLLAPRTVYALFVIIVMGVFPTEVTLAELPSVELCIVSPTTGHTYVLLEQSTWTEAQAAAIELGGNLATIGNLEENDWVYATFAHYGGVPRNLWIGFNDVEHEDNWVWISGAPVTYTKWYGPEPDDFGGQDYAFIINDEYFTTAPKYQPPYNRGWGDASDVLVSGTLPMHGVVEVAAALCVLGDLNHDGSVNGTDLAIVLGSWGPCTDCVADINDDGVVDGNDLAVVLGGWTG